MNLFKFRKPGDSAPNSPVQPESVERLRQRAKHRLIGASVLVLVGVVGFPLLFDKQPRPIAVDMPIDIPDKNKVAALALPAPVAPAAPVAAAPAAPVEDIITESPDPSRSVTVAEKAVPEPAKPASKAAKPETREPDQVVKPVVAPVKAKPSDGEKALALLEGKTPQAAGSRYVVQVGAFADEARARQVRQKIEQAGIKTYTHVAETKDGKRIRVRVGPFANKEEADKASQKIKKLNLTASLLSL